MSAKKCQRCGERAETRDNIAEISFWGVIETTTETVTNKKVRFASAYVRGHGAGTRILSSDEEQSLCSPCWGLLIGHFMQGRAVAPVEHEHAWRLGGRIGDYPREVCDLCMQDRIAHESTEQEQSWTDEKLIEEARGWDAGGVNQHAVSALDTIRRLADALEAHSEKAQAPSSDERDDLIALLLRSREWNVADRVDAILGAGFRRTVQAEPTDAQVDAAIDAFNDPQYEYAAVAMRAALRAAFAVKEGENR